MKVDNTNRTAVLYKEGHLLPEIVEPLRGEYEVNIAKISWLSKKDTMKAYCSMVAYVAKRAEAERLLTEHYFHVAAESARGLNGMALLARVQRAGSQAITGAFSTVNTAVAEAEASLRSVTTRHSSKATSFWVNANTLPLSYPLTMVRIRRCRKFA